MMMLGIILQVGLGLPEFVINQMKDNGVAGAIVFVLLLVIVVEAMVIKSLYGHNQRVYGFRLSERDTLNKALTDATAAIVAMKEVSQERNEITDELSVSFKLMAQKVELNHNVIKDELSRNGISITTAAAVYARTVEDIKALVIEFHRQK